MFHVYKTISREKLFAFVAMGKRLFLICVVRWVILCSDEEQEWIYSAFRSFSPGQTAFGEGDSTMFRSLSISVYLSLSSCGLDFSNVAQRKTLV